MGWFAIALILVQNVGHRAQALPPPPTKPEGIERRMPLKRAIATDPPPALIPPVASTSRITARPTDRPTARLTSGQMVQPPTETPSGAPASAEAQPESRPTVPPSPLDDFFSRHVSPEGFLRQRSQGVTLGGAQLSQPQLRRESSTPPPIAARPTIRGVWMTTSDLDMWRDRSALKDAIAQLADLNFNTIYPVVWNAGYTIHRSTIVRSSGTLPGTLPAHSPGHASFPEHDILADLIEQSHRHHLWVIPWFEYGLMVPPQSELAQTHPDWLTQQQNGDKTSLIHGVEMAWLNPVHPEVQQFLSRLMLEVVHRYAIDGIQIDDHFSLPKEFGYDDYTRSRYTLETGRKLPHNPSDPAWVRWRANQITALIQTLHRQLKQVQPSLVFSVSPNAYDFAYRHYLQDWRTWLRRGWIDELIVQLYRPDYVGFVAQLKSRDLRESQEAIPTGVGILAGLRQRPVPLAQLQAQAQAAQKHGFGVSFFFYKSLWENAPESIAQRQAGLRSLFPEFAPRVAHR